MIIARSPLRVTLGGGGTDLPSYYEKFGGFLIAAAIDKYVYITVHDTFVSDVIIKYSELERATDAAKLKHPIFREAFALLGMDGHGMELTSMADIPSGTGLGSSGSFTTALLKALHAYKKNLVHPAELAAQACEVEIDRLKEPIGKQDQYIAAYGGITCFKFLENGKVEAWPLKLSKETRDDLEDNLLLFFTGYSRSASAILKEQDVKSKSDDKAMIENLHFVKDLGLQSQRALESGNLAEFARLMDVHWLSRRAGAQLQRPGVLDPAHAEPGNRDDLAGVVLGGDAGQRARRADGPAVHRGDHVAGGQALRTGRGVAQHAQDQRARVSRRDGGRHADLLVAGLAARLAAAAWPAAAWP